MVRKPFVIALYSLKRWLSDIRIMCLFIIMTLFVWKNIGAINTFCQMTDMRVNPLVYPFFISNPITRLIVYAGVIFLFADAPFMNESQPYVLIRSKRMSWGGGQIIYVCLASAVYFSVLMLVPVIRLAPNLTFATKGWGKVINTLAQTNATTEMGIPFLFSNKLITYYSPWQAFLLCFVLQWGVGVFFGLLMFCISLNFNKTIGLVASGIIMFYDIMIMNSLHPAFYYSSPVSLSDLNFLDNMGVSAYPSVKYAVIFFIAAGLIMSAILLITIQSKSVEITQEV